MKVKETNDGDKVADTGQEGRVGLGESETTTAEARTPGVKRIPVISEDSAGPEDAGRHETEPGIDTDDTQPAGKPGTEKAGKKLRAGGDRSLSPEAVARLRGEDSPEPNIATMYEGKTVGDALDEGEFHDLSPPESNTSENGIYVAGEPTPGETSPEQPALKSYQAGYDQGYGQGYNEGYDEGVESERNLNRLRLEADDEDQPPRSLHIWQGVALSAIFTVIGILVARVIL